MVFISIFCLGKIVRSSNIRWVRLRSIELAIGYMSALTHDFMGKALEVWRQTSPGIVIDCLEMDTLSQERALIEGRIAVGILVPSDRPLLELLRIRLLVKYPVSLALPKSHPHADKPQIALSLLKDEPFI